VLVVYLAALVIALGVVGVQLFGGGDAHDAAVHGDVADVHVDLPAGAASAEGEHAGSDAASLFLSTRFWTFALLAFGLVGALLQLFQLASPLVAFALAFGSGLCSGLFAALVFRALRRTGAWTGASLQEAVGTTGRVIVPCAKGRVGKVRVSVKGAMVDLLAMTEAPELEVGARVLVSAIEGDIAKVERAPLELEE
jgi:membrane protein implicated in regulation of membrane protease activity